MKGKAIRNAAYLVSALGVVLHVYLTLIHPATGSVYNLIVPSMNVIPYLACILVACTTKKPIMPLCAGLIILLIDIYQFHEWLLRTRTYRFILIEIYQVIIKTAVIVPIGCFIGFMLDKLINRHAVNQVD